MSGRHALVEIDPFTGTHKIWCLSNPEPEVLQIAQRLPPLQVGIRLTLKMHDDLGEDE